MFEDQPQNNKQSDDLTPPNLPGVNTDDASQQPTVPPTVPPAMPSEGQDATTDLQQNNANVPPVPAPTIAQMETGKMVVFSAGWGCVFAEGCVACVD